MLKVSSLAVESEITQDGLSWKDILKISTLAVEVEIPQEPLYIELEVNSFNIYLGATPITKIYQGSTEITNTKY